MAKHKRAEITIAPDSPPPRLLCPACDRPLRYVKTIYNGVSPRERWDVFECQTDGEFEYRHRTRRLRATPATPAT